MRKPGRPRRVTREAIEQAVRRLPMGELSMNAVAEELDVHPSGLYRFLDGRGEPLPHRRLPRRCRAASLGSLRPALDGLALGVRVLGSATASPRRSELTGLVWSDYPRIAERVEAVLDVLVGQGFTPDDAFTAFETLWLWLIGYIETNAKERTATLAGRPPHAELQRRLTQAKPEEFPQLRAVFAARISFADTDREFAGSSRPYSSASRRAAHGAQLIAVHPVVCELPEGKSLRINVQNPDRDQEAPSMTFSLEAISDRIEIHDLLVRYATCIGHA